MCLAVPGKIISVDNDKPDIIMSKVSFSGIIKSVCLDLTPEARVGDYVLVHVGFALNTIDEKEAKETLKMFHEMEQLADSVTPELS